MRRIAAVMALGALTAAAMPARADAPTTLTAGGSHAAIATDQHLGSETGLRILREGGTAVDAAIAIAYTLAVTFPDAGNIGGGGFMLIRMADGRSTFIDFRETAPAAATADMYLDAQGNVVPDRSVIGPLAAAVPGTVAGLEYAREHYATRSRHELMRDAIGYARDGFVVSEGDRELIASRGKLLAMFPASAAALLPGGAPPTIGSRLMQPDLAATLEHVDREGAAGFYHGPVAEELAGSIRAAGGIMTTADLAAYHPIERRPLTCSYRGHTIITSPLPSSGGVAICEVLGMLAHDTFAAPKRSFANTHLEAEAERRAFFDRNTELGDPAFVHADVAHLLDPSYLAKQRASFAPERATPSSTFHPGMTMHEGTNTTNYSVIDAAGNAADVTYTLNNSFGSNFIAGRTGVLMNDEMDDFTSKPGVANMFGLVQGTADAIAPGKRPLSSMSPTIVLDSDGHVVLAAGAAGGPRIITTTLDMLRAVIDFNEDPATIAQDPRMHLQWLPDTIYAEPTTFDAPTLSRLRAAGYTVTIGRAMSVGNAVAVRSDGTRVASHDPRSLEGAALAY
jgi:gamma-glutamyltranspeptidase/glutathione hydrolase